MTNRQWSMLLRSFTILLAISGILLAFDGTSLGLLLSGIIIGAGALLVIWDSLRRDWANDYLLLLFTAFFTLVYPGSGIVLHFFPSAADPMLPSDPVTLCFSMQVGGAGWLSLVVGYWITSGYFDAQGTPLWKGEKRVYNWKVLAVAAALGIPLRLFVQLYIFAETSDSTFATVGVIPQTLFAVAMICGCALLAGDQRASRIASILFISIYSAFGLFTGQRADALVPWLILVMSISLYARWRGGSQRRPLMALAGLGFVLVLLFPILTSFKEAMGEVRTKTSGIARVEEGLKAWQDLLTYGSRRPDVEGNRIGSALLNISERYSHLQYGSQLITKGIDQWGFLGGQSLVEAVIVFIPRLVWPDKPEMGLGPKTYLLMGYTGPGSATVPIAVDWYLNFGILGVVLGMPLVGVAYALLTFSLSRNDPLSCSLLANLGFDLMQSGQGIANIPFWVIMTGVLVSAIRRFAVKDGEPAHLATRLEPAGAFREYGN